MKLTSLITMFFVSFFLSALPSHPVDAYEYFEYLLPNSDKYKWIEYYKSNTSFGEVQRSLFYNRFIEFNDNGKIIKMSNQDFSDDMQFDKVYTYNDNNLLIEEGLSTNDKYFKSKQYEYSPQLRKETYYNLDGIWKVSIYKMDNLGRVIQETSYNASGKIDSRFTYEYSKDLCICKYYTSDGELSSTNKEFYRNDKIIKREDYYKGKLSETLSFAYDQQGNLASKTLCDINNKVISYEKYEYTNNKLTRKEINNIPANYHLVTIFEYNGYSDILTITEFIENYSFDESILNESFFVKFSYTY